MSTYACKLQQYLDSDTESICLWFVPANVRWMSDCEIVTFDALLALADD